MGHLKMMGPDPGLARQLKREKATSYDPKKKNYSIGVVALLAQCSVGFNSGRFPLLLSFRNQPPNPQLVFSSNALLLIVSTFHYLFSNRRFFFTSQMAECLQTEIEKPNQTDTLPRKIDFVPVRKPFKGFSNDFHIETLNPTTTEPRQHGSGTSLAVSKKHDVTEFSEYGLDPDLSFGMTVRRIVSFPFHFSKLVCGCSAV